MQKLQGANFMAQPERPAKGDNRNHKQRPFQGTALWHSVVFPLIS
jgi:hypothetical protein